MPAINQIQVDGVLNEPFRRTLNFIGATISDSSANDRTDISFNTPSLTTLTVSGLATFNGDVDVGNAATDTLTITSVVDSHLTFIKEVARTISIGATTTAATAGAALTIKAGDSGTSGAGGALALTGGAAAASGGGNGGAASLDTGAKDGAGTDATLTLGGTNANAVAIGRAGKTTTFNGPVSLGTGISISGVAGAGAVTFGSMTGDMTLPTGSISWAGAGAKTMSLVGAAAFTLTGGATSVWSVSSGDLRLDSAAVLNLGTTAATSVQVGRSGQSVGFFGISAVTRPTAYTQTFVTADKTHANLTLATLTDSSGGTAADTIAAITGGGANCENATKNAIATFAREQARTIVDLTDLKSLVNSVIDDLQALGLLS